uniref:Uncharacterized protein n=1 Tax=Arundo donax TaxID=35708 RepID=A0A0A9HAX0_ARUDO
MIPLIIKRVKACGAKQMVPYCRNFIRE